MSLFVLLAVYATVFAPLVLPPVFAALCAGADLLRAPRRTSTAHVA